jgi:hypothetical protein
MPPLFRHPDTPPGAIYTVDAELRRVPGGVVATFHAVGDVAKLVMPSPVTPGRTDDLWRTTCFELFVAGEGESYREFNLSPSSAWAGYEFDGHRTGRCDTNAQVEIETSLNNKRLSMIAKIESEFPDPAQIGLTAVIEETDGLIRYWATAFAPGEPDFHAAATRSLLLDGVSAE